MSSASPPPRPPRAPSRARAAKLDEHIPPLPPLPPAADKLKPTTKPGANGSPATTLSTTNKPPATVIPIKTSTSAKSTTTATTAMTAAATTTTTTTATATQPKAPSSTSASAKAKPGAMPTPKIPPATTTLVKVNPIAAPTAKPTSTPAPSIPKIPSARPNTPSRSSTRPKTPSSTARPKTPSPPTPSAKPPSAPTTPKTGKENVEKTAAVQTRKHSAGSITRKHSTGSPARKLSAGSTAHAAAAPGGGVLDARKPVGASPAAPGAVELAAPGSVKRPATTTLKPSSELPARAGLAAPAAPREVKSAAPSSIKKSTTTTNTTTARKAATELLAAAGLAAASEVKHAAPGSINKPSATPARPRSPTKPLAIRKHTAGSSTSAPATVVKSTSVAVTREKEKAVAATSSSKVSPPAALAKTPPAAPGDPVQLAAKEVWAQLKMQPAPTKENARAANEKSLPVDSRPAKEQTRPGSSLAKKVTSASPAAPRASSRASAPMEKSTSAATAKEKVKPAATTSTAKASPAATATTGTPVQLVAKELKIEPISTKEEARRAHEKPVDPRPAKEQASPASLATKTTSAAPAPPRASSRASASNASARTATATAGTAGSALKSASAAVKEQRKPSEKSRHAASTSTHPAQVLADNDARKTEQSASGQKERAAATDKTTPATEDPERTPRSAAATLPSLASSSSVSLAETVTSDTSGETRRRPLAVALDSNESWEGSHVIRSSWTPLPKTDVGTPAQVALGHAQPPDEAPPPTGEMVTTRPPLRKSKSGALSRAGSSLTATLLSLVSGRGTKVLDAGVSSSLSSARMPMQRSESSDEVAVREQGGSLAHPTSLNLQTDTEENQGDEETGNEQQQPAEKPHLPTQIRAFFRDSFPIQGYPDGRLTECRHFLRGGSLSFSLEYVFTALQECFELQGEKISDAQWTEVQLTVAMLCKVLALLPRDPAEDGDAHHTMQYWLEPACRAARRPDIVQALESARRRLRSGPAAATTLSDELLEDLYPPTFKWVPPPRVADVFAFDTDEAREVLAQQMTLGAAQLWVVIDVETLARFKCMSDQLKKSLKTNAERKEEVRKVLATNEVLANHVDKTFEFVLQSVLNAALDDNLVQAFNLWTDIGHRCYNINNFLTASTIHRALAHTAIKEILDHMYKSTPPPELASPLKSEGWKKLAEALAPLLRNTASHTATLMGNEGPQVPDMVSMAKQISDYGNLREPERFIPIGAAVEALEKTQQSSYGYRDVQAVQKWLGDGFANLEEEFANGTAYYISEVIIDPGSAQKLAQDAPSVKNKKSKGHLRGASAEISEKIKLRLTRSKTR